MQISHLTTEKKAYIEIINSLLKNNIGNEKSIYFNNVYCCCFVVSCNNKITEVVEVPLPTAQEK
jgi:hypothetical protein